MPRKVNSFPFFITFFLLSILLIILGASGLFSGISGVFNKTEGSIRNATFNILTLPAFKNRAIETLTQENQNLRAQLVDKGNLISEDKALRDQFAVTSPGSTTLVPAKVYGYPGFLPGVSSPSYLVIGVGSRDGIKKGSAVVVKNNLVGRVTEVSPNISKVEIVTNTRTSFTGKIQNQDDTNGVAKGSGSGVVLENVVLSRSLKNGQLVLTKGDVDSKSAGFPPDLVVGKIISVDKKPSDLFQKAEVQSFVNFENLGTVFVIK